MPLSKIVSRWALSTKDYFRFICMWWGPLYDHEDQDIENSSGSSKRVEPRKRKVRQGLQTYDGSLCKVLPAQSLCTISQSTRRWIFFNMHNADSFCEQCWTRPLRISCRTPTYTCMTTPWRRNCSSGADMWPTPQATHSGTAIVDKGSTAHLPNCRGDNLLFGDLGKF